MNTISITTSQNIELEYELGSLGDRIVGWILDWLVIGAYVVFVLVLLSIGSGSIEKQPILLLVLFLPILFYDLLSEILLNGQSVGKKVMGIKVMSLAGEQATISQYLIRWLFRFVDFTLFSGVVALITVAVTERRQRVGDLVAGTVLIKTKPRTEIQQTIYQPTVNESYMVTYPEVAELTDKDIQLVKEVVLTVKRTGNTFIAIQAQEKIESVLGIKSRSYEPIQFLYTVLQDYNHLTSQL